MAMNGVDKLREWLDYKVNRYNAPKNAIILNTGAHPDELYEIADEIEAEIKRDYMRLPRDADGVPIRVGDEVCGYGRPDGGVVVKSLNGSMIIVGRPDGAENYAKSGLLWAADSVRHYHAPTVEDVLREVVAEVQLGVNDAPHIVESYADKLREVLANG